MITHGDPILFLPAQSRISGMAVPKVNPGGYILYNKRVLAEKITGGWITRLLLVET
jgi:hypothetical protein